MKADYLAGCRRRPSPSRDRLEAANQPLVVGGAPVRGHQCPHRYSQLQFLGDGRKPWVSGAPRRPHPPWRLAQNSCDRIRAGSQLLPNLRRRTKEKIGMGIRVIADHVAAIMNLANQFRILSYVATNEEESGRNIESGERVEQLRGDRGIWSVVEGDGQPAGRIGAKNCLAEELRARMNRPVRDHSRCSQDRSRSRNQPGIHKLILARPTRIEQVRAQDRLTIWRHSPRPTCRC